MSPTLLELVVAAAVIIIAWQLGLALAPEVFRLLRHLRRDIDEATDEALAPPEPAAPPQSTTTRPSQTTQENHHDTPR